MNKPPGMLVQGDITGDASLLDWCKAYLKEKFNKEGKVYLGLVHRLDRPVSGVVVFARTSKAAARLSEQFRQKNVEKVYLALAEGRVPHEGELVDQIVRDGATSRIAAEGQKADLAFRRLKYDNGISLVEVRPGTGRHHQIRLQFASRGYPLLGDFRYGSKIRFGNKAIALHAASIAIIHPTLKEKMVFRADRPSFWDAYL